MGKKKKKKASVKQAANVSRAAPANEKQGKSKDKSDSWTFPKTKFYPYTKTKCAGIGVRVQGLNSKTGTAKWNEKAQASTTEAYMYLRPPHDPVLTSTYTQESFKHEIAVDTKHETAGEYYRVDSVYNLKVVKTDVNGNETELKNDVDVANGSAAFNVWWSAASYANSLLVDEQIAMDFSVYSRGPAGNSTNVKAPTFKWAYPHQSVITSVTEKDGLATIQFSIDNEVINEYKGNTASVMRQNTNRRTDGFRLQVLKGFWPANLKQVYASKETWRELAAASMDWQDVGLLLTEDDAENIHPRSFVRPYAVDKPSGDKIFARTYYRIKAVNDVFDDQEVFVYSPPMELPGWLEIPSSANEELEFVDARSGDDGTSIRCILGYKIGKTSGGDPNSDACQITWSDDPHAWQSTQQPSSWDMPDEDIMGNKVYQDDTPAWRDLFADDPQKVAEWDAKYTEDGEMIGYTSTVYIRGLSEATPYYLKARRYLEETGDLDRTYGPWATYNGSTDGTAMQPLAPSTKPGSVNIYVPPATPMGKDLEVSWTFDSDAQQTEWELYWAISKEAFDISNLEPLPDAGEQEESEESDAVLGSTPQKLASGKDASGYAVVAYSDIEPLLTGNQIWIKVSMKTTGEFTSSTPVQARFVQPPKVSLGVPDILTKQPLRISVGTNDPEASLILRVFSSYIASSKPDGVYVQPEDTVIYSQKLKPEWQSAQEDGEYYSNIQLPSKLDLIDNGTYYVQVTAVNDDSGLDSEIEDSDGIKQPEAAEFTVMYEHQAYPPSDLTHIHTDKNALTATIYPIAPDEYQPGDVCDIYRVTPDGAVLVASDVSFGSTVVDPYPPYSKSANTRYRIATRTPDGDLAWRDFAYCLKYHAIRFNWSLLGEDPSNSKDAYNSLDIPYNLTYSDSYKKEYESRLHFEGNRQGYWRSGVTRTGSFTTQMVKFDSPEEKEALKSLARHAGAVLVRRPDGSDYAANVDLNNYSDSYDLLVLDVGFDVEEIALTDMFKIAVTGLLNDSDREVIERLDLIPDGFQDSPLYELSYTEEPVVMSDDIEPENP